VSSRVARLFVVVGALLGVGSLAVGAFAGPAGAQDPASAAGGQASISRVDATGRDVVITGTLVRGEPGDVRIRVVPAGGEPLEAVSPTVSGRPPVDLAVVIDNSPQQGNGPLQLAVDGLRSVLPGSNGVRSLTVLAVAGSVRPLGTFTDADAARRTLDTIVPAQGGARLWDGVRRAVDLLERSEAGAAAPPVTRQVLVLGATPDGSLGETASSAAAALKLGGASLRAVLRPYGVDAVGLSRVAETTGGSAVMVADDDDLPAALDAVGAAVGGRVQLRVPAPPDAGRLEVYLDGARGAPAAVAHYEPGQVRTGSTELAVAAVAAPSLLDRWFSNPVVLVLTGLVALAAVVVVAWTVLTMVIPDEDRLERRLEAYEEGGADRAALSEAGAAGAPMATVPILRRAVHITGEVARKRGLLELLEARLERASLPLRAAEAMFFLGAAVVLLSLATLTLTRNLLVTLVVAAVALAVPHALLDVRIRRRSKAFEAQLPDMLSLMAGTLRAGYSIAQGFEAVSREIEDPMGRELRRVITEHRLGRPLEDALDSVASRMASEDFAWAVMAIKIQREVGGNLAELLLTVANTMTERERLRRDVATLTAEGRMSAIVLGLLPPGLAVVMYVMNPGYIAALFSNSLGMGMLGLSVVAMLVGFAWMKKIIAIEV
jgi:tight adherence protein B